VCNAGVGIEDLVKIWFLLLNECLQLGHLAKLLEGENLILLVTIHCETGRVVATVLESGETVDEGVKNGSAVLLDQVIDAVYVSICPCASRR